jgi:hypothetical protein
MARIARLVEQMRPLARVVVDEELAATLEGSITDYVAQWLAAAMPAVEHPNVAS